MRKLISIFLISVATLLSSQTRNIKVNISQKIFPDKLNLTLNSQAENLNNCSVQIIDSMKKVLKTVNFPKAVGKQMMKQFTEVSVPLQDLAAGYYTYIVYLGKEEMHKQRFFKDAILAEPMGEPSPKNH